MSLSPIFVELRAGTSEFMMKMNEAEERIHKLSKHGASPFDKLAAAGKGAFLGIGAAAAVLGTIGVKAALKGEEAHARLAQAVANTGHAMEELDPKVEALVDRYAKLGFGHAELESGLAVLTTSLRDPEKALQNIGLAADLARYKQIPLAEAAQIVAKGLEGQLRPLRALGIDLPVAAGGALKLEQAQAAASKAQEDYNRKLAAFHGAHGPQGIAAAKALEVATGKLKDAQRKLSDQQGTSLQIQQGMTRAIGGQAQAAANTYAGRLRAAQAAAENLAEKLGNALLPKIAAVLDKTTALVGWLGRHRTISWALAGVIGGALVTAMTAYVVKQAIALYQMGILAARTVYYNAAVAVMLVRTSAAAGALTLEAAAARTLAGSLLAVAAAAAAAYLAYDYFKTEQDLDAQERRGKEQDKANAAANAFNHSPEGRRRAAANKAKKDAAAAAAAKAKRDAAAADKAALAAVHAVAGGDSGPSIASLDDYIHSEQEAIDAAKRKKKDDTAAKARAEAARRAKAALDAAVARAKAAAAAVIAGLQAELRARQEIIRAMVVQEKLARRAQDLSLVNGNVINQGTSFQQAAGGQHVTHLTIHVGDQTLTRTLTAALQKDTRQNVSLGIA